MRPEIPERVLQFGTGVLLRGLPDYFIEKANRQGRFNGGILVVKSTDNGQLDEFERQDCQYTLVIKGLENGEVVDESIAIAAISRVLSAASQWDELLESVTSPDLAIVISNTTEVGIALDEDDRLDLAPPRSFPGKLTAVLYRRFIHFNGDITKGLVILPTELISDNGAQLKGIVLHLAEKHGLGTDFREWLIVANDFCNTLVDRIVPGRLSAAEADRLEGILGYRDDLAIMAEPFRLWAVESNSERVRGKLSFAGADHGVIIAPDIQKFKELKLRLLNGAHTFSCGLASLAGFDTVKEAMGNIRFSGYVKRLMLDEIVPTLLGEAIAEQEAVAFANSAMDRFANPFLDHKWSAIGMNYSSKMVMRNAETWKRYIQRLGKPPRLMALGVAGYMRFMGIAGATGLPIELKEAVTADAGFAQAVSAYHRRLASSDVLECIAELVEAVS